MSPNVSKQTFHISHVCISLKVKGVLMWNLQHVIFVWRQRCWLILRKDFSVCPRNASYLCHMLSRKLTIKRWLKIFCQSVQKKWREGKKKSVTTYVSASSQSRDYDVTSADDYSMNSSKESLLAEQIWCLKLQHTWRYIFSKLHYNFFKATSL